MTADAFKNNLRSVRRLGFEEHTLYGERYLEEEGEMDEEEEEESSEDAEENEEAEEEASEDEEGGMDEEEGAAYEEGYDEEGEEDAEKEEADEDPYGEASYYDDATNTTDDSSNTTAYDDDNSFTNKAKQYTVYHAQYNYQTSPNEWSKGDWAFFALFMFIFGNIFSVFFFCIVFPCCCPRATRTGYARFIAGKPDPKEAVLLD